MLHSTDAEPVATWSCLQSADRWPTGWRVRCGRRCSSAEAGLGPPLLAGAEMVAMTAPHPVHRSGDANQLTPLAW